MADLDQKTFLYRPVSYTVSAQRTLFTVRDSYFQILSCIVRIEKIFTAGAPTVKVGTVATVDLLAAAADVTEGTLGVYKGVGSGLTGGGALVAPGTAIIVDYTADAATTQGVARITITGYRVGA